MKLTDEQKARFGPMLQRTYEAIGPDVEESLPDDEEERREAIVEVTCDANHPEAYGGMSREEHKILCEAYRDPDTQSWLRKVLNY